MSALDSILKRIGLIRSSEVRAKAQFAGGGQADSLAIYFGHTRADIRKVMSMYTGWAYACVRAIAEEMARIDLKLYRVKKDGTAEELPEHELLDALHAVNVRQTGYELKYITGAHLEMVGNCYWLLEGVKNDQGKPTSIKILDPQYIEVKPVSRDQTEPDVKYIYKRDGITTVYNSYEVLHFMYPDPADPLRGVGTLQAVMTWVETEELAMRFNRAFFANGAKLGGTLETEASLTTDQLDYIKKSFKEMYSGAENAYNIAAMPSGVTFKEVNSNAKDMDFVEGQRLMRDKILAAFRVPKTVLGISDDVNRANAEATNYVFALRTIRPKYELLVSYLNEFFVPRYGADLYLGFADPVQENRGESVKEMQAAVGSQPVMSLNEAREEYFGLGPIEGGDVVVGNISNQPIGAPINKPAAENSMRKRGVKNIEHIHASRAKSQSGRSADVRRKIASEVSERVAKALADAPQKSVADMSDADYEKLWLAKQVRLNDSIKQEIAAVQKVNSAIIAEVSENMKKEGDFKTIKEKAIDLSKIFDHKKYADMLVSLSMPIMETLYGVEGENAAKEIGVTDITIVTPTVEQSIKNAMTKLAESHDQTITDRIGKQIRESLAANEGLAQLTARLQTIEEYSNESEAKTVAVTETNRISNEAKVDVWKRSGIVKSKRWYTAEDERVCPYCEPLNGQIVGIDESYFDDGDTVTGSDGSETVVDYGDVEQPPLHANCRCDIRPDDIQQ